MTDAAGIAVFVTASIVERVGAYVGFGAFLGLAILALLYFSQARDVRRLREWAGRAPERAAELEQRPVPTTPAAQTPAVVRKPLPAQTASATGPAAAGATAAQTAAGKAGPLATTPATPAPAAASDDKTSEAAKATEAAEATSTVDQPTVAHTPVTEPPASNDDGFEDLAPLEPLPREHYLPGTSFREERPRKPLHQRARNVHIPQLRYVVAALAVLALLVFGLGTVTGVIGGGDSGSGKGERASKQSRQGSKTAPVNIDPSQVTVAVLNGTTVTGLAFKVSQEAKAASFKLGNVTNAATTDQQKSEVLYAPGQRNAARAVADRLGISTVAPVDSVNAEIAGSADAIVLVGGDRSG